MINFEMKKLVRRPAFLFVFLVVTAVQVLSTTSGLKDIRPEKAFVELLREYSEYSIDEAAEQIALDSAAAAEDYYHDYTSDYEDGSITIEQFRAYQQALPQRVAYFSATRKLLSQVEQLMASKENMADNGIDSAGMRVIDETGWILSDRIMRMWLCPLALAFLVVAILCEWHDSGMYELILTTADGKKRTLYTKLSLCIAISLLISIIDSIGIYLIPQLVYGLGTPDAAIQSVAIYKDIAWGISLKTYAAVVSLVRMIANMLAGGLWMAVALLARKSYIAIGIILLIILIALLAIM